jgi:hypothetical protein
MREQKMKFDTMAAVAAHDLNKAKEELDQQRNLFLAEMKNEKKRELEEEIIKLTTEKRQLREEVDRLVLALSSDKRQQNQVLSSLQIEKNQLRGEVDRLVVELSKRSQNEETKLHEVEDEVKPVPVPAAPEQNPPASLPLMERLAEEQEPRTCSLPEKNCPCKYHMKQREIQKERQKKGRLERVNKRAVLIS